MRPTLSQMLRVIVMMDKSSGSATNASQYAVDNFDHHKLAKALLRHLWKEPTYVRGSADRP